MTNKKKTQSPQNIYYKIICAIREGENHRMSSQLLRWWQRQYRCPDCFNIGYQAIIKWCMWRAAGKKQSLMVK